MKCRSEHSDEEINREEEENGGPSTPSSTKTNTNVSVSGVEEAKTETTLPALQIPAYPPPPPPSLLASMGSSLNQQQQAVAAAAAAAAGPLAYPRPIHPALMLEAMGFHQRMMPDGRPTPYTTFLAGQPQHHLLPRYKRYIRQEYDYSNLNQVPSRIDVRPSSRPCSTAWAPCRP